MREEKCTAFRVRYLYKKSVLYRDDIYMLWKNYFLMKNFETHRCLYSLEFKIDKFSRLLRSSIKYVAYLELA